ARRDRAMAPRRGWRSSGRSIIRRPEGTAGFDPAGGDDEADARCDRREFMTPPTCTPCTSTPVQRFPSAALPEGKARRAFARAAQVRIGCAWADWGASALGGDQLIDPRAQLLQHEVLLGRGFAVVDLLDPPLQRHLDPEGLIDGEGDVEKVERVDPQIVDDVALRRDLLARDVADLRDDVRDGLEGGCHDVLSFGARRLLTDSSAVFQRGVVRGVRDARKLYVTGVVQRDLEHPNGAWTPSVERVRVGAHDELLVGRQRLAVLALDPPQQIGRVRLV